MKPKTIESLMEQLRDLRHACEVIAECHAVLDSYGIPPCEPGTPCDRPECNSHLGHRIHTALEGGQVMALVLKWREKLRAAGVLDNDMISVPGDGVIKMLGEFEAAAKPKG
jgi:hypothetical protein